MTRFIKMLLLFAFLAGPLFVREAHAQTINAASCKEIDVANALASITADGTSVVIPPGDCVWTTSLSYTQTNSFVLQGAGAISGTGSLSTISGTGADGTIIEDDINHSNIDPPLLAFSLLSGKSFRMTGIAFKYNSANTTTTYNGSVRISGTSFSLRIDHNHFNQINVVDLNLQGWLEGVIDHNQFDAGFPNENQMRFGAGRYNNDTLGYGDQSWADTSHWGSSGFLFAENNNYQQVGTISNLNGNPAFAFDCDEGGRFVFRYNAMGQEAAMQTHGTGPLNPGVGGGGRGCRAFEIYNNAMNFSQTLNNPTDNFFFAALDYESGTSLWWGNTFTGFRSLIQADIVRTNTATYTAAATPNGWGYCGMTNGPSSWDQNTSSTGHACLDSIGRGKGDLLKGGFPNRVDSVTGTITWPNQASDPVYMWMNTFNLVPNETNTYWSNFSPVAIVENQDYYLQLPNVNESATFTGTAGTGYGLLSARPSTCTPFVGYWATDTNTLYQCATTNAWTTYYTPYTYPHPLDSGSVISSGSPAAPSSLTAVVQ